MELISALLIKDQTISDSLKLAIAVALVIWSGVTVIVKYYFKLSHKLEIAKNELVKGQIRALDATIAEIKPVIERHTQQMADLSEKLVLLTADVKNNLESQKDLKEQYKALIKTLGHLSVILAHKAGKLEAVPVSNDKDVIRTKKE